MLSVAIATTSAGTSVAIETTTSLPITDARLDYCNSTVKRDVTWPATAAGGVATQPCPNNPQGKALSALKWSPYSNNNDDKFCKLYPKQFNIILLLYMRCIQHNMHIGATCVVRLNIWLSRVCLCLSVRLSVHSKTTRPNFTDFFVLVAYDCGSVLL